MFEIIKNVIESKRFELVDILKKIDVIWLQGNITEEEKESLVSMARENAIPENSYAPYDKQISDLNDKIKSLQSTVEEHSQEIQSLKKAIENLGGTVTEPEEPEPSEDEYAEYVQPTGAHDAYHRGDKVTFNGEKYICVAPEGVACVWSPTDYPAHWEKQQ